MGAKWASVYLRTDNAAEVLEKLKSSFDEEMTLSRYDKQQIEQTEQQWARRRETVSDPEELAKLNAHYERQIEYLKMMNYAVLIVYEHFVSICWYDEIRVDNVQDAALEYAELCGGIPALGAFLFDDDYFGVFAVRGAGTPWERRCSGDYYFFEEDVRPVEPEELCEVLEAPFLLETMREVLSLDGYDELRELIERHENGEDVEEQLEELFPRLDMAGRFVEKTGMPMRTWEGECREKGMKELFRWGSAFVFDAR